MSPENTHETPDQQAEVEAHYEINPGDVLFVSRNLKNPDGTPRLDDEGKRMTELEDGWEVVTLNGINPTNGREGIMLRNTNDPDELKFYSDRQVRDIQKNAEVDIMQRASSAASEILGEIPRSSQEVSSEGVDLQAERHEELLIEVSEDIGREATEEVVENPNEAPGGAVEAQSQSIEAESSQAVASALFEFTRRESYSAEELQNGLSRALRTYEENGRGARVAADSLQSLADMRTLLTRAVEEYDESIQQMGGRPNPDYDPRVVLYRRVEQHIDTLHHAKRAVTRVSEQEVADIRRASQQLSETLGEVSHEVDKDEANIAGYFAELHEKQGIEVPEPPKSGELRGILRDIDAPLKTVTEKAVALDTLSTNAEGEIQIILRELDSFLQNVQHGMVDRESLQRIQDKITGISSDDKVHEFSVQADALNAAIDELPRRVPELQRR